jgi:endo-1,4-beta-mannosidase
MLKSDYLKDKEFFVGCNYWASHAGTDMWSNWKPEVIEKDLALLKENGVEVIRVFPLWPVFQPLTIQRGGGGRKVAFSMGEKPLGDSELGQAGICKEAMNRFQQFLDMVNKYDFKLVIGLVTGWMSGRLFVPPALDGKNVFTDPEALFWQTKFVREFVKYFKDHPSVWAWDLGNECNCMSPTASREEAWVWTSMIVNTIHSEDKTRPIISGMHSLSPEGHWTMQDQGELTDLLTTHPYPLWTPYCDYEPLNSIRPVLHATAESLYYKGIGGKPCFAEELGTMGPMMGSEETAGNFLRGTLFTLWAHDCKGMMWWCAFDQKDLIHAPYDWMQLERELGFIDPEGRPKKMLQEMSKFKKTINKLPFKVLPQRKVDAVCVISHGQEHWPTALGSFILAKQVGMDIEYCYQDQPLPESELYLLPCITGHTVMWRRRMNELLEKVSQGAVLYISWNDGFIADFETITGLKVISRIKRSSGVSLTKADDNTGEVITVGNSTYRLNLEETRAKSLYREEDGNAAFTEVEYGKGKVYFLTVPVEIHVIKENSSFTSGNSQPYYKLYEEILKNSTSGKVVKKNNPYIGVTEHAMDGENNIVVAVNYNTEELSAELSLKEGWSYKEGLYGNISVEDNIIKSSLKPNEAMIFMLHKE